MSLSDEALADQFQRGDPEAFRQLFERHLPAVHGFCLRILGDAFSADDAAQETFMRVFRKIDLYDKTLPFKPWLMRIAGNISINIAKRRRPFASGDAALAVAEAETEVVSPPEEALQRLEDGEAFRRAFAELSVEERMILDLRYFQEIELERIADMLGLSRAHASIKLFRARQALHKRLEREAKKGA